LEPALFTLAATLIAKTAENDGGFHPPSIFEFFPPVVLFEGTPFALTRIHLIQIIATVALILIFWLGTRRMKIVPGRFQSVVEMGLDFVRNGIAHDLLGRKDGNRFLPILTTIFFMVLFMNITGIIPGPVPGKRPSNVDFGGPNNEYLYITQGDKVFRRKTKSQGVLFFKGPILPTKPRL